MVDGNSFGGVETLNPKTVGKENPLVEACISKNWSTKQPQQIQPEQRQKNR